MGTNAVLARAARLFAITALTGGEAIDLVKDLLFTILQNAVHA